uniref:adenosine deaminase n=1 Tax=Trepomonas sp. PC1 TaxID=1076344 RepID=A0A146K709_9EUKA|eukprot:JAP92622.1 Adenosine deaminase [Trepomonas sp. PC1]
MSNTPMQYKQLKKAELHLHFDGSISIDFVHSIINKQKIVLQKFWSLQDIEDGKVTKPFLQKLIYARQDMESLVEYLKAFEITGACMQTEENLIASMNDVVENYVLPNNITHVELRYAPAFHTGSGLSIAQVHDIVMKAALAASKQHSVSITIIACTMKLFGPQDKNTLETYELYFKKYDLDQGYDQAGPECMFQPPEYIEQISKLPIPITIHAGEAFGPAHVKEAIECGALRIGHGVRMREDPEVVQLVKEKRVLLEMCPTSNTQTNVENIKKDLTDYPMRQYLLDGIRVCINTDNQMISQCTISSEIELMVDKLKLEPVEVLMILDFGYQGAFLEEAMKQKLRSEAFEWNAKLLSELDPEIKTHFAERMKLFE